MDNFFYVSDDLKNSISIKTQIVRFFICTAIYYQS